MDSLEQVIQLIPFCIRCPKEFSVPERYFTIILGSGETLWTCSFKEKLSSYLKITIYKDPLNSSTYHWSIQRHSNLFIYFTPVAIRQIQVSHSIRIKTTSVHRYFDYSFSLLLRIHLLQVLITQPYGFHRIFLSYLVGSNVENNFLIS